MRFIRGDNHYKSIFDSYLMSLCPIIVGSVGAFAATTSLLADPPCVFIRARPEAVRVQWRRWGRPTDGGRSYRLGRSRTPRLSIRSTGWTSDLRKGPAG